MTSAEIRQGFLDFFESKGHKIVPSAPIVNRNDPTLMFINSGMAPFKDYFLGNRTPESPRIADTQKCLRVSGKHNDLEDVGMDGTHLTLFEMLGNWSFGDYFKEEAIAWSFELLTKVYNIPTDRIYATVFGGDKNENLESDEEAKSIWKRYLPENHILYGNKKDNFWEMGETGPCGPCSEIHFDMRPDIERGAIPGETLVNKDHPLVVEIWNNVFMQYERRADKSLVQLPARHVDTGMGFERLCMVLQQKTSAYDTDVFSPFINYIEKETGIKYTGSYDRSMKSDIAMRVCSDHIRSVCFTIADGQLPSNTGAGYVIRRILRRAVRYYFSFLDVKEPFLYKMIPLLADNFRHVFPELKSQQDFVTKVVLEEEKSFLRTIEVGLKRLDEVTLTNGVLDGRTAFELFDTYGFPIDLTTLIMAEKGYSVDDKEYSIALEEQKNRSRQATARQVGDWMILDEEAESSFVGYDRLEVDGSRVIKYRTVSEKGKDLYQVVLNVTPFYPEGGGQVGDSGVLDFDGEKIKVIETRKENDLIIHFVNKLPAQIEAPVNAIVDAKRRGLTENNHSATHLVHAALRQVLGTHVQQRGSLVNEEHLRFDFSHFQKVSDEELVQIESIVNHKIRENIPLIEDRDISIEDAKKAGAMMLFGEKYGTKVRMITFDPNYSRELCGGTHVKSTGKIGLFKFKLETAVAAGVRRIEAVTSDAAEAYLNEHLQVLDQVKGLMKNPKDLPAAIESLQEENKNLRKQVERMYALQTRIALAELKASARQKDDITVMTGIVEADSADVLKQIAAELRKANENLFLVIGAVVDNKPQLLVALSDSLTQKGMNAGNIIRDLAKHIQGGGGGQPFLATAGGKDASGLSKAIEAAAGLV